MWIEHINSQFMACISVYLNMKFKWWKIKTTKSINAVDVFDLDTVPFILRFDDFIWLRDVDITCQTVT
jgi:hypothetical protein